MISIYGKRVKHNHGKFNGFLKFYSSPELCTTNTVVVGRLKPNITKLFDQ